MVQNSFSRRRSPVWTEHCELCHCPVDNPVIEEPQLQNLHLTLHITRCNTPTRPAAVRRRSSLFYWRKKLIMTVLRWHVLGVAVALEAISDFKVSIFSSEIELSSTFESPMLSLNLLFCGLEWSVAFEDMFFVSEALPSQTVIRLQFAPVMVRIWVIGCPFARFSSFRILHLELF